MTLENMLRKKLVEAPAGQQEVALSHHGWNVAVHPAAQDSLSCSLNDVTLQREGTPPGGDPQPWAEQISASVTGLLEPLKVHEVDAPRKVALLRSATPTSSDPGVQYYEVELHGTTQAKVRRFRGYTEPGHKREQIPFALTYEGLARVIGGIITEK